MNICYVLINTMNSVPAGTAGARVGYVESCHSSHEAAEAANDKLQRAVKKANGAESYMPTRIIATSERYAPGEAFPWSAAGALRVEAGAEGSEDYDTGRVLEIDGDRAYVAWDTGVRTWNPLSDLRAR